jgi:hypothetical protein
MRSLLLTLAVLALPLGARAAPCAHEEEAKRLYDHGMELYNGGHFDAAIAELEKSYGQCHKPALLLAIGQLASAAAIPGLALDYFQRYLGAAPDAPDRKLVEARITQLKKLHQQLRAPAATSEPPPPTATTAPNGTVAPSLAPGALSDGNGASVVARPAPAPPLTRRVWFWCAVGGGALVVAGALALGITLGSSKVYPTPTLPPAQVK